MNRTTKIWLIAATVLILTGCMIFRGAMTVGKWKIGKLSEIDYETNRYEIEEAFGNISVLCDTADIVFVPSENGSSAIICYEEKNARHSVKVQDGALVIAVENTKKWYDYVRLISAGTPKITLQIPKGEYGALSIKTSTGDVDIPKEFSFESMDISMSTGDITSGASSKGLAKIKAGTGDITVEGVSAGAMECSVSTGKVTLNDLRCEGDVQIKVSTGKVKLRNVECKNLISTGNTGDLSLENVIASEKFSLERTTGEVEFDRCDAAELYIRSNTGRVHGSLLSSKIFICQSSTGSVNVPKTTSGGKCEVITSTGSIKITVE